MGASGLYSDLVLKGLGAGGEGFLLSAQMGALARDNIAPTRPTSIS